MGLSRRRAKQLANNVARVEPIARLHRDITFQRTYI